MTGTSLDNAMRTSHPHGRQPPLPAAVRRERSGKKRRCLAGRQQLLRGVIAAGSLLLWGCSEPPVPVAPRPARDVILIVIDTLRADHLGCYGYDRETSPNIDGLAARGVRFENAVAQSSWTAPSMVSLLQSKHLAADFVRMPPGSTLAERLAEVGYRCVGFQDNILLAPGTGFDRGFELYEVEAGPAKIIPALQRDDPRPLFAYFHFVDPHDPYEPLPQFDVFEPRPVSPERRQLLTAALQEQDTPLPADEIGRRVDAAAQYMAEKRALYDGDVRQTDARVEFILSALERTGRLDDAYIILAADHGECLWDQPEAPSRLDHDSRSNLLRLFKMSHNTVLYGTLTRTPLLMSGPDIPEGTVVDGPVENVDIVPTVLELLGLSGGEACDGRSLVDTLQATSQGGPPTPGRLTWSNTSLFTAATSVDGFKLIRPWDPAGADPPQLFDLTVDPGEQTPLPLQGDRWRALHEAIDEYRRSALMPAAGEDLLDDTVAERMRQLGYLK